MKKIVLVHGTVAGLIAIGAMMIGLMLAEESSS